MRLCHYNECEGMQRLIWPFYQRKSHLPVKIANHHWVETDDSLECGPSLNIVCIYMHCLISIILDKLITSKVMSTFK